MQNENIETVVQLEKGYHEKVKHILGLLYPRVPISIINAGISGDRAEMGLKRVERDVLSYKPDIVVVCYGLNDSMLCKEGMRVYIDSLKGIFEKIRSAGVETIF